MRKLLIILAIISTAAYAIKLVEGAYVSYATRIPRHEASALASIRAINEAEMIYASSHPDVGFTANLATLGGTGQGGGEQTLDNGTASGRKNGYTFTYTPGEKVNGAIRSYTVTAVPDQVDTTGRSRFFSDESGNIRYNAAGPADANSPVIQ
jgi:type IV pilus assembly protein PilA